MPWRVEYHEAQEIVEIAYWGRTDVTDIRDGTLEAIRLVKMHRVTRGLVDCLEQTKTAPVPDLYDLPKMYDEEGLTRRIRIAFIEPSTPQLHELAEFYENVCVNRGWQLESFIARDAAIAWLLAT